MIDNKIHPIPETSIEAAKIENLQTRPNSQGLYGSQAFSPTELKQRMDSLPILAVNKVNELIEKLHDGGIASNMSVPSVFGEEKTTILSEFLNSLKEMILNGGLAGIIKTGSNEDAMSVLAFLNYLQTQIGDVDAPADGSLRKQINTNKSNISELREELKVHKTEISEILEQMRTEINGALDSLIDYADSLAPENEVTS